jgi:hypothetical protein
MIDTGLRWVRDASTIFLLKVFCDKQRSPPPKMAMRCRIAALPIKKI